MMTENYPGNGSVRELSGRGSSQRTSIGIGGRPQPGLSLAGLACIAIFSFLMSSRESCGRWIVRVSLSSLPVNLNGTAG